MIEKARRRHGDRADQLLYKSKKKKKKGRNGSAGGRRPSKELQMRGVDRLTGRGKHAKATSKKVSARSRDWELYDERGKKATFKFKMNRKSRELAGGNIKRDSDDEDGPKDTFTGSDTAFFARQDTKITKLRKELERSRGEREYNAKVDKKVCPSCGAAQTYDEVAKRKKRCGQCSKNNVFRPKRTWGECKASFARRTRDAETRRARRLERVRKAEDEKRVITKKVFDKRTGTFYEEVQEKVRWDHVANSFLGRQQDAARARERKIKEAQDAEFRDITATRGTNFRVTNAISARMNADKAPFEERMEQDIQERLEQSRRLDLLEAGRTGKAIPRRALSRQERQMVAVQSGAGWGAQPSWNGNLSESGDSFEGMLRKAATRADYMMRSKENAFRRQVEDW